MHKNTSISVLVLMAGFVVCAHAHSWIACTDYLQQNGQDWDQQYCRGFPRHGHQFVPKTGTFGADTGYNVNNPPNSAPCRTRRDDSAAYNPSHPKAVYYPGQKVILAHPTKNHVADVRCTNKYIPDSGNRIMIGPKDATADPTLDEFKQNVVADLGRSPSGHSTPDEVTKTYPKPGYQNAPKFCENMDKALATNDFTVPNNLAPGRYTFLWAWYFNSLQDLYTSCWEVDVVASKAERDALYSSKGISTQDPVDVSNGGGPTVTAQPPTNGVDGQWSEWSSWSACSATCGDGQRSRSRSCNNPAPQNGGQQCQGNAQQIVTCNERACSGGHNRVDGQWSDWSSWGGCSVSCGNGQRRRSRSCNNPNPQNGGQQCQGNNQESAACNYGECSTGGSTGGSGSMEIATSFTHSWDQGANARITMPNPRPEEDYHIIVQFPCQPTNLNVWHARDVTTEVQRRLGILVLSQSEQWMRQKADVGFSLHFGSCGKHEASDIITYILEC